MRHRGLKKYLDNRNSAFKIQITSMVDMFVILLVFLLKSYSTSPVNITPNAQLRLPQSTSPTDPVDVLKVIVSKQGVFVENQKVADLDDGRLPASVTDARDPQFIRPLYQELDKRAESQKNLAKINDTVNFNGQVLMQIDRSLPYSLLKKVMYTSMLAGYYDVKLAVMTKD